MITVYIPDNFIPERIYAVRTLLTHYSGIPVEIVVDHHATQYELKWGGKSIVVADDRGARMQGRGDVDVFVCTVQLQ